MKSISVTLYRKLLTYEVESVAFITGEVLATEDDKLRAGIMDVAREDCRIDRLNITLNKAFGELVHALTAYTETPIADNVSITNMSLDPESSIYNLNPITLYDSLTVSDYTGDFFIRLYVSDNFSAPNIPAIKNAMSAYVVNKALAEWFSITKKDEVSMYEEKAEREILNLHRFMRARVTPVRRKLSTF